MPRVCFIPGCRTHKAYYERGVAMFSYPREPELRATWNAVCSRHEDFQPPRYACICEKHFDPSEVQGTSAGRASLLKGAVPSRYLDGWRPEEANVETHEEPQAELITGDFPVGQQILENDVEPLSLKSELIGDAVEQVEPLNVEEVFIKTKRKNNMEPEVSVVAPEMFCRMCGIKHEQESKCDLINFLGNEQAQALLDMCLMQDNALKVVKEVCLKCIQEIRSFLEFIKSCHEGQKRLQEQLLENQQTLKLLAVNSQDDPIDHATDSDGEEGSDVLLSDPEENENEEIKDGRMDRYIDRLIRKLKSEKRPSNVPRDWECLDCRELFQHRNHLAIHRRTCQLVGSKDSKRYGPFSCQLCSKVSKTLPGYRYHLLKMHDKEKMRATGCSTNNPYTVDENDENYPEELRALKSRKTVVCPICTDTFRTCGELRYHLPTHKSNNKDKSRAITRAPGDDENPKVMNRYMCSVCGKMERSNAGLEIHMKFHLKQKDWPCELCDKQYYTKADLRQHVLTVHEKITYTCDDCGTVLNSRATFTRHRRLHDESQLKQCTFCVKKFTTSNALKRHVENRHLGQKRPRMHGIEALADEIMWEEMTDQQEDALEEIIVEEIDDEEQSELSRMQIIKEEHLIIVSEVQQDLCERL